MMNISQSQHHQDSSSSSSSSSQQQYQSIRNTHITTDDNNNNNGSTSLLSSIMSSFQSSSSSNMSHTNNTTNPILKSSSTTNTSNPNNNNNSNNNNNNNNSNNNINITREEAIQQATNVINSKSYQKAQFDNFNLLGVVTTPRTILELSTSTTTSTTGTTLATDSTNNNNNNNSSSTTNNNNNILGFESYMDTNFLNNVSEILLKEITLLNSTINSYSRSLSNSNGNGNNDFSTLLNVALGGGNSSNSYSSSSGSSYSHGNINLSSLEYENELYNSIILSSNNHNNNHNKNDSGNKNMIDFKIRSMDELPKELIELDLSTVESYLNKCGLLAKQFDEVCKRYDENDNGDGKNAHNNIIITTKKNEGNNKEYNEQLNDNDDDNDDVDVDNIAKVPDIFFNPSFDLTDPKTFESLLVLNVDDVDDEANESSDLNDSIISIDPIIRIPKPDELTQYLDTVELSLLNHVRSKSDSFFRETNRFSYLKSLVADLVDEVKILRDKMAVIRQRSVTEVESIPIMDRRRKDIRILGNVLDEVGHVLEVKSSVTGLIANGEYLGAVEAIHKARSLLSSETLMKKEGESSALETCPRYSLGKIVALNKVNDQLAQYENLVVMDLSNNVVELFLSWDEGAVDPESHEKVKSTIIALKKCKKLSTMSEVYRGKLCDTIKVTIRTTVSECAADAAKDANDECLPSATIVSIPNKDSHEANVNKASITKAVTSMNFEQFMDCLDMIFEQTLNLLQGASTVNKFCLEEGIELKEDEGTHSTSALAAASDLSHKSISEILRLRKDAHSLISFEDIRRLWDSCLKYTLQVEKVSGQKAYGLRSTLLAQAKAFVERKHESNMSSLVAALDGERWNQCDVSSERQAVLDRLCTGRAVLSSNRDKGLSVSNDNTDTSPFACVEGTKYRVVWSCLLLIEHVMSNVACAVHFQTLTTNVVGKVSELFRLFNTRATQLVLGAGAIHSTARLKSINAKHLALVTQCVGVILSILPHVRAALMAQLPNKQHGLLVDLDKIKKEYAEHHDKVLSKFVGIIGGIVEHSLVSRIANTNFDDRSKLTNNEKQDQHECCSFFDGVITNTKKMHQVLVSLLPSDDLMDVFSRIFSYLDSKVPKMLIDADAEENVSFSFPSTIAGKKHLVLEVNVMAVTLNDLPNVRPWDFGAMKFLERKLELPLEGDQNSTVNSVEVESVDVESAEINTYNNQNGGNNSHHHGPSNISEGFQGNDVQNVSTDNNKDEPANNISDTAKLGIENKNDETEDQLNGSHSPTSSALNSDSDLAKEITD